MLRQYLLLQLRSTLPEFPGCRSRLRRLHVIGLLVLQPLQLRPLHVLTGLGSLSRPFLPGQICRHVREREALRGHLFLCIARRRQRFTLAFRLRQLRGLLRLQRHQLFVGHRLLQLPGVPLQPCDQVLRHSQLLPRQNSVVGDLRRGPGSLHTELLHTRFSRLSRLPLRRQFGRRLCQCQALVSQPLLDLTHRR